MSLHKNLSGADLHDPKGVYPTPASIPVDEGEAYKIYQISTTDNYLRINTIAGAEEAVIGNTTTNPKLTLEGTGLFTTGGGQKVAMATITGPATPDLNADHFVALVNTTAGAVTINLVTPSTVANQTFVFIDTHSQFGTNNLILHPKAAEKIDNVAADKTISTNNARLTLFCDGTDWFTVIDTSSATSGIAAVVDDLTPQLGGTLDCNGNDIIIDNDNSILDENSQEQITFLTTGSAVNQLTVTNAAAGGNATAATSTAPIITGGGTTTNCDLALQGQGTGTVTIRSRGTDAGTLSLNNEANTFAVNITVPLADELAADYTLTLPVDDGTPNQVLETDGSGVLSWVTPSAGGGGYTVSGISADPSPAVVDYYYVIDSSGGAVSITLPNAGATASGKTIGFKARHGATNAVTLNRAAGGNIDGITSNFVMSTDMAAVELICDGTDWWIKS